MARKHLWALFIATALPACASSEEPQVLARNEVGQTLLAMPAIAGGAIYLRSDQTLFCIGAKKAK